MSPEDSGSGEKSQGRTKSSRGSSSTKQDKGQGGQGWVRTLSLQVPKLTEDVDYETWRKDVKIWDRLSPESADRKAMIIHLTLSGKAKMISDQIPLEELASKDGVDILLAKLDSFYLPDKDQRQFLAYNRLHDLVRSSDTPLHTFVCNFEHEYYKHKQQGMPVAEAQIINVLIRACNLPDEKV